MAQDPDWISQSWCFLWIFTLLLSESQTKRTQTYYMDGGLDCGDTRHLGGAVVYSHKLELSKNFNSSVECRITFKVENDGWRIMLRIIELDIPDMNNKIGLCNDALYIFDDSTIFTNPVVNTDDIGNNGLCGHIIPSTLESSGPFFTVYFRSNANEVTGSGFKFIVTAFSDDFKNHKSCGSRFLCENEKCIDEDLTCDKIDHCGDYSDESADGGANCGVKDETFFNKFLGLGVTASVTITVGSLIVLVVCVVAIACCCRRSFCKQSPDTTTGTTSTSTAIVANGTASSYPPGHTNLNAYTANTFAAHPHQGAPHLHQGYYPMQPVFQAPTHGSLMFSGYNRDVYTNSGSAYSSHSQSHPPSHHRSYTPTSSRSGKSIRSNNSTSVTYSQITDKVSLPVNL